MKTFKRDLTNVIIATLVIIVTDSCTMTSNQLKNRVFDDAVALWKMEKPHPKNMVVHGDVAIGKPLPINGPNGSKGRGVTSKIADFNGGYIDLGQGKHNALNFEGYNFTLHIRFCIPDGNWDKTIISKGGEADKLSWKLYGLAYGRDPGQQNWEMSMQNYYSFGDKEGKGYALEFMLGVQPQPFLTEGRKREGERINNTFRIGVPVEMIGTDSWHDVTVRFAGSTLEMFVDGVLVDEEWPIGQLRKSDASCLIGGAETADGVSDGFTGMVDYAAVWDKAITDDEIKLLSGGLVAVEEAKKRILGVEQESLQYWKPRGHNIWAGDVVPAYKNGRFHMFYLYDRRHHASKWGAGAHQFAHYSSTDLVHWEKHPMALALDWQWETFGTGCPIFVDNRLELHYGLHTTRFFKDELTTDPLIAKGLKENGNYLPILTENIDEEWLIKDVPMGHAVAVSEDGITFRKLKMVFTPAQNMCVFSSAEKKQYCLLYDNQLSISKDLREWAPTNESFLPTGKQTIANNTSECPNFFEWNGWYYILMGGSGFWISKEELGNYWEGTQKQNKNVVYPRWDIYDGTFVPMVASFNNNRRLLAGWTFSPYPHGSWAGYLVFRELIQYADGTLGMKWPEEMIPKSGSPVVWNVNATGDGITKSANTVSMTVNKLSKANIDQLPLSYHFTANLVPGKSAKLFGIQFMSNKNDRSGFELQFQPTKKHVQWGTFKDDNIADFIAYQKNRDSPHHPMNGVDFSLENVEDLDKPFKLELIVKYDTTSNILIADVCIDNRRTMITHRYKLKCHSINLFAADGEVNFKDIIIRPLL